MPNILTFKTLDVSSFLVFGVTNAKYLTFDTPDENALIKRTKRQITLPNYLYI